MAQGLGLFSTPDQVRSFEAAQRTQGMSAMDAALFNAGFAGSQALGRRFGGEAGPSSELTHALGLQDQLAGINFRDRDSVLDAANRFAQAGNVAEAQQIAAMAPAANLITKGPEITREVRVKQPDGSFKIELIRGFYSTNAKGEHKWNEMNNVESDRPLKPETGPAPTTQDELLEKINFHSEYTKPVAINDDNRQAAGDLISQMEGFDKFTGRTTAEEMGIFNDTIVKLSSQQKNVDREKDMDKIMAKYRAGALTPEDVTRFNEKTGEDAGTYFGRTIDLLAAGGFFTDNSTEAALYGGNTPQLDIRNITDLNSALKAKQDQENKRADIEGIQDFMGDQRLMFNASEPRPEGGPLQPWQLNQTGDGFNLKAASVTKTEAQEVFSAKNLARAKSTKNFEHIQKAWEDKGFSFHDEESALWHHKNWALMAENPVFVAEMMTRAGDFGLQKEYLKDKLQEVRDLGRSSASGIVNWQKHEMMRHIADYIIRIQPLPPVPVDTVTSPKSHAG